MRFVWLIILLMPLVVAGCARYPTTDTVSNVPERTLISSITVNGEINPAYYYFLAIDTDADSGDGPVPIVTGPELGNGWGTISDTPPGQQPPEPPFWVQYHNGRFEQFQNGRAIGSPYRAEISPDRKTMTVEIDEADIATPLPTNIQLNWITQERIDTSVQVIGLAKDYDGFGPRGNTFVNMELGEANAPPLISGENGVVEELPNDTTDIADIDLIEWRIQERIRITAPTP